MLLYVHFSFAIILMGRERERERERELIYCFALFIFLVSCDRCLALPHGPTGVSAVCDHAIS